ncbi:MAG: helix-turn-helix domain-containing protein [Rhizomicrobium sp.]
MDIREIFARNLRRLRDRHELSQEELAHAAKIDRTYVSALERGVYSATITMVAKLAAVFGVTPASMIEPDAKPVKRKKK